MDYDVVVVGARAAGATTAMLLARAGLRVLAVDRAHFPSDTLSTHQIQVPGVARLRRWRLLDAVAASGAPGAHRVRFDAGTHVLDGEFPEFEGADAVYSPRRTVLDAILVDAARVAGAEVVEGFDVTGLTTDGDRVTGIRGAERRGGPERAIGARAVIGADGKNSRVAREVGAEVYHEVPARAAAAYAYWSGLPVEGGEMYVRDRRMVGAWPTNDGLVVTYVGIPADEFDGFRADADGRFQAALDACGTLGERARAATRVEHLRSTNDLPNRFRRPYGPGWALVGDAGVVMDPVTGQGIGLALRDADELSAALVAGLSGARPLDEALAGWHARRDAHVKPIFDNTVDIASFRPNPLADLLFSAIAGHPERTGEFLSMLTGAMSPADYFAAGHLVRVLGVGGMVRALARQLGPRRRDRDTPTRHAVA